MTTYTVSLVSVDIIKDDISPLVGHEHLWRVEHGGRVLAYCTDKKFADRITDLNLGISLGGTGNFFCYPNTDQPIALCCGPINSLLRTSNPKA